MTKLFSQFKIEDQSQTSFVGLADQRATLREIIELKTSTHTSDLKQNIKIKGVLVHGPQGIGKTLLIKDVLSDMKLLDNTLVI